jgi:hypothetical protein
VNDATTKPHDPTNAPENGQPQSQQKPRNQQRTHTSRQKQPSNQGKNVIAQMLSTLETIFESLPPHNVFSFRDTQTLHTTSDNVNKKERPRVEEADDSGQRMRGKEYPAHSNHSKKNFEKSCQIS